MRGEAPRCHQSGRKEAGQGSVWRWERSVSASAGCAAAAAAIERERKRGEERGEDETACAKAVRGDALSRTMGQQATAPASRRMDETAHAALSGEGVQRRGEKETARGQRERERQAWQPSGNSVVRLCASVEKDRGCIERRARREEKGERRDGREKRQEREEKGERREE